MKRRHLFEIEDFVWCPNVIRETTTDFLLALYSLFNIYEPAYQKIEELLTKTQSKAIVDCCSGSGGPIRFLRHYLDKTDHKKIPITLTDKYPNQALFKKMEAQFPNTIKGHMESLDASQIPPSFAGIRTFFSSFHHFSPNQALRILQNAVDAGMPIAIFESTQRHPLDFLRALFSPILVLFMLPLAKQLTFKKFFFTYIIPITPFTYMWDYMVSNIRTYSLDELRELVAKLHAPHYHWEIGKLESKKTKPPYLIGYKLEKQFSLK